MPGTQSAQSFPANQILTVGLRVTQTVSYTATATYSDGSQFVISGTWQLLVTDFKNDGNGGNPTQRVDSWSLHFSAYINNTGFSSGTTSIAAMSGDTRCW